MAGSWITVDGNDACASVAYRLSDVIAIYPITPSSSMAEAADAWAAAKRPNLWGAIPSVVEMQSEGKKTEQLEKRVAELERMVGQKQLSIDYLSRVVTLASEHYKVDLKKNFATECLTGSTTTSLNTDTS